MNKAMVAADLPDELYFRFVVLGLGVRYTLLFPCSTRDRVVSLIRSLHGMVSFPEIISQLQNAGYVDVTGVLRIEREFWKKVVAQEVRFIERGGEEEEDGPFSSIEHLARIL